MNERSPLLAEDVSGGAVARSSPRTHARTQSRVSFQMPVADAVEGEALGLDRDSRDSQSSAETPSPPPEAEGASPPSLLATGRVPAASHKLGTVPGVFMPVFMTVWALLFYIRFGLIISQAGVLGTIGFLLGGFTVTTLTTLSISAIATNGKVRAGGPYFIISRCLGPEFGGSIGIILYIGSMLGCTLNAVGLVEPLLANAPNIPHGRWPEFGYASAILALSTLCSIFGSKLFSRLNYVLFFLLNVATLSVLVSIVVKSPVGPSWIQFQENLFPAFEKPLYTWRSMFGLLFPCCTGILAGASMSGELKDPSRSIPRGTFWGMGTTLTLYIVSVLVIGSSIPRSVLRSDMTFMYSYALAPSLYTVGVFATAFFAVFGLVVGTAKLLRAVLKDRFLPIPVLSDRACIAVTYLSTQCMLVAIDNVDRVAPFFTQTNLLCYSSINLACLLLRIAAAPNFRPSFRYFGRWTAAAGLVVCLVAMFVVDVGNAAVCLLAEVILFAMLHFFGEPKNWGDVSQSLMYHQVRKFLLKMDRRQTSVKTWRPQILLILEKLEPNEPLIRFGNDLKKGSLFVVAHVMLGSLQRSLMEYRCTLATWLDGVQCMKVKAFVQIDMAPTLRQGSQSIMMGAGLGNMRPNIVVLPFSKLDNTPPDTFLGILEDALSLDNSVGVARNFTYAQERCEYIDLWPLCISLDNPIMPAKAIWDDSQGRTATASPGPTGSTSMRRRSSIALKISTADDVSTFTLVLHLGYILRTTDKWRKAKVRLFMLVEKFADVGSERGKLMQLLQDLRMRDIMEIHVVCMEDNDDVVEAALASYKQAMRSRPIAAGAVSAGLRKVLRSEARRRKSLDPAMIKQVAGSAPNQRGGAPSSSLSGKPLAESPESHSEEESGTATTDNGDDSDENVDEKTLFKPPKALFSGSRDSNRDTWPTEWANQRLFGALPLRGQCAILNRIMAKYSAAHHMGSPPPGVVFTSLPPIPAGLSRDASASAEYMAAVETLSEGLPPLLMVQTSQLTVTTQL